MICSSNISNRTLFPFTVTGYNVVTYNSQFSYNGGWSPDIVGFSYPRVHTAQTNAYVTFDLRQTSAFFVYGLVNLDLSTFSVTMVTPSILDSYYTSFYNSSSRWISLDQVMFWKSGMDRDTNYTIMIKNLGGGGTPWWDFSRIDLIDGGPLLILFVIFVVFYYYWRHCV